MEKRNCPVCGTEFSGRVDKIYCSSYCKNTHHNRENIVLSKSIRTINKKLRTNRNILAKLNPKGKNKVYRKQLEKEKFDFDFFTNSYTTKNGNVYRFCYDQGYLILEDGMIALVEKKEYV